MRVKDLRVLITGAASGVGRTIAKMLADADARVFVSDISGVSVADLSNIRVIEADAGNEAEIDDMFTQAERHLGGLDVLINNAGIAGPTMLVEDISLTDWAKTFDVNVTGHCLCAQRAIPLMKTQKFGSIVNVSSMSAVVGLPMRLPYAVSKAAVLSLTQNLARELGPFSIRVNAILPGLIEGDQVRRVIAAKAKALSIFEGEYEVELLRYRSMRTWTEMGRANDRDIAKFGDNFAREFLCADARGP